MGHNILSLHADRFNTRVALGGCLLNIDGETVACEVAIDQSKFTWPKFRVTNKQGEELCTFTPYDLWDGPILYSITPEAGRRASASLIVPSHGLLKKDDEDEEMDDRENAAEI